MVQLEKTLSLGCLMSKRYKDREHIVRHSNLPENFGVSRSAWREPLHTDWLTMRATYV